MDYLYGKLNNEVKYREYKGSETTTATVTIDDSSTVSVDVKKVPNELTITTINGDTYTYDGSEPTSFDIRTQVTDKVEEGNNLPVTSDAVKGYVDSKAGALEYVGGEGNFTNINGGVTVKGRLNVDDGIYSPITSDDPNFVPNNKTVDDKITASEQKLIDERIGAFTRTADKLFTDVEGGMAIKGHLNVDGGITSPTEPTSSTDVANKEYVDAADAKKVNVTGGTITGSLAIQGDLTVTGTTTTEKAQTLAVKDSVIVTNADGAELGATLSGIAIKKDGENTYGVMYDPSGDSVKLGLGTLDSENRFTFNDGGTDGKPIATRADSSALTDGDLVKWDGTTNSLVDSGKKTDDFVAKVTTTSGSNLAYVSKNDGTQGMFSITTVPTGGSLAQRKQNGGAVEVGTAVGDSDAMPKKQVEDGFVAKIETGEQAGDILYGRDASNNEKGFIIESTAHNTGSIVQRKSGGAVEVGTAVADNDATTKEYVDSALEKKLDTYTGTAYYPVIPVQRRISASDPSAGYTQGWEQLSGEAINGTVVLRTKNGTVATSIPKSDKDATPKKYVEDNFIPKSTFTGAWQVLVTGENSDAITTRGMSVDPANHNIPNFDNQGRLLSNNPDGTAPTETSDKYAVNVGYANAKYVAKTTQTNIVYGTGNSGDAEYTHFSYNPANWNITKFDGTGCLRTNNPTGDDGRQCVNKQYADGHYAPLLTSDNPRYPYFYTVYGNNAPTLTGGSLGKDSTTVAIRGEGGRLQVGTPVGVNDATTKQYVDDGFVAKVTTGNRNQAYTVDTNNQQQMMGISVSVEAWALAQRGEGGRLQVGTAVEDSDAMPKKQVEDGFVHKGTSNSACYCIDYTGAENMVNYSIYLDQPYTLAQRDVDNTIKVGTPVGVNDATTKAYVDNLNTITITAGA